MRYLTTLVLTASIASCGGGASDPPSTSEVAVYEAVLDAVSDDRQAVPRLHPGTIRVDSRGSYPGHRSDHYEPGEAVYEAMSGTDVVFCGVIDDGGGCDVQEGSWIVFSKVEGTDERPVVWATWVEEGPRGPSLRYYRADLTDEHGRYDVDLTLLAIEN